MGDYDTPQTLQTQPSTGAAGTGNSAREKKESSTVLNITLLIIGILFIGKSTLDALAFFKIQTIPSWLFALHKSLGSEEAGTALSFLGTQPIVSAVFGVWSFISGILLFRESKSGWGMAMVVLSTIAAHGISIVISWFTGTTPFEPLYWPNWIIVFTASAGVFGFFFLILTRKRFT